MEPNDLAYRHPLRKNPYNRLLYVRSDHNHIPLYSVKGAEPPNAMKAEKALRKAAQKFGFKCYYCGQKEKPEAAAAISIDHLVASANGGCDHLHNLVLACRGCNSRKQKSDIGEYMSARRDEYLKALVNHISENIAKASQTIRKNESLSADADPPASLL